MLYARECQVLTGIRNLVFQKFSFFKDSIYSEFMMSLNRTFGIKINNFFWKLPLLIAHAREKSQPLPA